MENVKRLQLLTETKIPELYDRLLFTQGKDSYKQASLTDVDVTWVIGR